MGKKSSIESIIDLKIQEILKNDMQGNVESFKIKRVILHPLVLLSVVDHHNRMGHQNPKDRVAGVLLGNIKGGILDVSNSFAVPFDEDYNSDNVWFFDHIYLERMYAMTRKINSKEKIVGWYHNGPKREGTDLQICELVRKFCPDPILVVIDTVSKDVNLPTYAFYVNTTVRSDGLVTKKSLEYLPVQIDSEEAEEVGVEHLLRDLKQTYCGSLQEKITHQIAGLSGLRSKLINISDNLFNVGSSDDKRSYESIYLLQEIFNLVPKLKSEEFMDALCVVTNDQNMIIYLCSLIRTIVSLNNLIDNRIDNMEMEKKLDALAMAKKQAVLKAAEAKHTSVA